MSNVVEFDCLPLLKLLVFLIDDFDCRFSRDRSIGVIRSELTVDGSLNPKNTEQRNEKTIVNTAPMHVYLKLEK